MINVIIVLHQEHGEHSMSSFQNFLIMIKKLIDNEKLIKIKKLTKTILLYDTQILEVLIVIIIYVMLVISDISKNLVNYLSNYY